MSTAVTYKYSLEALIYITRPKRENLLANNVHWVAGKPGAV